jgi:hypothetical protein
MKQLMTKFGLITRKLLPPGNKNNKKQFQISTQCEMIKTEGYTTYQMHKKGT